MLACILQRQRDHALEADSEYVELILKKDEVYIDGLTTLCPFSLLF